MEVVIAVVTGAGFVADGARAGPSEAKDGAGETAVDVAVELRGGWMFARGFKDVILVSEVLGELARIAGILVAE